MLVIPLSEYLQRETTALSQVELQLHQPISVQTLSASRVICLKMRLKSLSFSEIQIIAIRPKHD